MLIAKQRARAIAACACAFFSMQMSTSGGSSESEVNELTVMARIPRGPAAVTTETPLAQNLRTSLNVCAPMGTPSPAAGPRRRPEGQAPGGRRVHHADRPRKAGPAAQETGGAGSRRRRRARPAPRSRCYHGRRSGGRIGVSAARIQTYFLDGPAGRLECFLKHPAGAPPGTTAAVVCHPHPMFGGSMHNKVVHAAAESLARLGLPVVRFNFRGVGRSAGAHDGGRGETDD